MNTGSKYILSTQATGSYSHPMQESDKENRLAAENLRKKLVSCKVVSVDYSAVLLAAVLGPAVLKLLCADAEFLLHTW
jgi:hypothetical protein